MRRRNVACDRPLQNMTKSQLGHFCTMDGLGSKGQNAEQQHMTKLNVACDRPLQNIN